jgi:hypothetical protein
MLKNRTLTMSIKEIKRCEVLKMANEKQITQREGAIRIGVTERHFRRLLYNYREYGPEGITSLHRGMMSNNRLSKEKEEKILKRLKEDYQGFGRRWPVRNSSSGMGSKSVKRPFAKS